MNPLLKGIKFPFYIIALLGALILIAPKSKALNYSDFKPGRIIDDVVFTNKSSMNVDQIQAFLNSKVPSCDTNHAGFNQTLKRYTDGQGREVVNSARFDPPFTCIKDYQEHPTQTYTVNYSYVNTSGVTVNTSVVKKVNNSHRLQSVTFEYFGGNPVNGISKSISTYVGVGGGNISGGKSAAQIIYDSAQSNSINPQALIVTLEKETSLITDDWAAGWQYDRAMGWACPDTGIGQSANCDTNKEGFLNQVMGAGWQYRNDYNGIDTPGFWSPYGKGTNNILYNPSVACGSRTVNIVNQATAVLYKYTPYTPNDAAIIASPGVTVTCGAYGNRNFWRLFNYWFGSSLAPGFSWQWLSQAVYTDSAMITSIDPGSAIVASGRYYVKITVRNTGNATWQKGSTRLATVQDDMSRGLFSKKGVFYDASWASDSRITTFLEASVEPGQTGTFTFWVTAPNTSGFTRDYLQIVDDSIAWFSNYQGVNVWANVTPRQYSWRWQSQVLYTDNSKSALSPNPYTTQLTANSRHYAVVKVLNTGNAVWQKGSTKLSNIDPIDVKGKLYDSSWLSTARMATFTEDYVAPGQTATFEFWIKVPSTGGIYKEYFGIVSEGVAWMTNTQGAHLYVNVPYTLFSWQWLSQAVYTDSAMITSIDPGSAIVASGRYYVKITVRNTGNATWQKGSTRLATVQDDMSRGLFSKKGVFYDASWASDSRITTFLEASVEPGQTGTFTFWVTAPNTSGFTRDYLQIVDDSIAWFSNYQGVNVWANVTPRQYSWRWQSQVLYTDNSKSALSPNPYTTQLTANSRHYAVVKVLNTGNAVWQKGSTKLSNIDPIDVKGKLYDSSWLSTARMATFTEDYVAPGQTATFEFWIKVPSTGGIYKEYFGIVSEGVAWMTNTQGAHLYVNVP